MLEEVDAIHIRGGNALFGETTIQGSKNAVLPVMAAALLINDVCTIENCPRIQDVEHMKNLLQSLGCKVKRSNRAITCLLYTSRIPVPVHRIFRYVYAER